VTGRVFLLNSAQYTIDAPAFLDVDRSGLAVYGVSGHAKISRISPRASTPLLVDPGAYTDHLATADEPFDLPAADGALFPVDLDSVLQGQRECHAAAAITPSRYVQAGDSAAFKGLVRHAQAIERDDVIVAVPVAISWLKEEQYLPQLIAGLNRIPQPKALMFGEQNVNGQLFLPVDGQCLSPLAARWISPTAARFLPAVVEGLGLGQGLDPLAGGGLGEPEAVALGDHDVGVVQESVDGGGGEGFGHDLVEAGGVQVAGHGQGSAFVGGIDQAVEAFGGVRVSAYGLTCRTRYG
jgi:hypothetical protein